MQHMRSASVDAQRFSFAQDQEDAGEWLDDAVQRRRADGSAVYADSNFAPDPDLPEGPLPRAPERHCFIGQPRARVGFFSLQHHAIVQLSEGDRLY